MSGSAAIEVVADMVRHVVDIKIQELDGNLQPVLDEEGNEETAVELSVAPEMARDLAFRLSLAAIKVEGDG